MSIRRHKRFFRVRLLYTYLFAGLDFLVSLELADSLGHGPHGAEGLSAAVNCQSPSGTSFGTGAAGDTDLSVNNSDFPHGAPISLLYDRDCAIAAK